MKTMATTCLVVLVCLSSRTAAHADDKEVTLKGKLMCAKCELKETPKCQTVVQVKEGGKTVTYYFRDKGAAESYHEAVCGNGQKDGQVTGVVSEAGGKKWITPRKVDYVGENQESMVRPQWFGDADLRRVGRAVFAAPVLAYAVR